MNLREKYSFKRLKTIRICLVCVIFFVITLSAVLMKMDHYVTGDEVITYSMANSYKKGWMFSSGRVVEYLKNEVVTDSIGGTSANTIAFVKDLLGNFRSARYFTYPRPNETGWYTQSEIADCFRVNPGQRFEYGSVILNSMGDDANSYLYYIFVHTIGSLFPGISDTHWAAFIVNALALMAVLCVLYRIMNRMGMDDRLAVLTVFIYGVSCSCLLQVTFLRAYVLASVFHLLLYDCHLRLFEFADQDDAKNFSKTCICIILTYVFGYLSHYTILFWAVFLGINTIVLFAGKKKAGFIWKYTASGIAAVILGFIVDPVSVMGLTLKFFGTHENAGATDTQGNLFKVMSDSLMTNMTINAFGLIVAGLLVISSVVLLLRKKDKSDTDRHILLLGSMILEESVILVVVSGKAYFRSLYPLIFVVTIYLISKVYEKAYELLLSYLKDKRIGRIAVVSAALVYAVLSCGAAIRHNDMNAIGLDAVKDVLHENKTEQLVYIRGEGDCYEFVPVLKEYDQTLVITPRKGDYHGLEETSQFQETDQLTIVTTDNKETNEEIFGWMAENGIVVQQFLYDDGFYRIYHAERAVAENEGA